MATPVRVLPPRSAKTIARGVIYSTVVQDHPRSCSQSRLSSDVAPHPQAAQSASTNSHPKLPGARRGRPRTRVPAHGNEQPLPNGFPSPSTFSDPENYDAVPSARALQSGRDNHPVSQIHLENNPGTVIVPITNPRAPAMSGMTTPGVRELLQKLVDIVGDQSLATPARDGLTPAREGQTPDRVESQSPNNPGSLSGTLRLPRQVGFSENTNGTTSGVVRNLNSNFPYTENFAEEYSPRHSRRPPETREGGGNLAPCYPVQQNTNVSASNFKNKNNNKLAEANNFGSKNFPPAESFVEMDSAVSFRENIAEVDNQKTVRFKDGTCVVVPSEMDLDNSKIVEFLYNSAVKGPAVETQCEKTRVLVAGSDCQAVCP